MTFGDITRNAHRWLPEYLRWRANRTTQPPARLWLTIADHYEPYWLSPPDDIALQRVATWRRRWPETARRNRDSSGRPACYTFFYPQEEYRPAILDSLAGMTAEGVADVEIHIHHDNQGERDFLDRMSGFVETLSRRHGLLHRRNGNPVFGFIHGDWALDNSHPDGRYCGLNNELTLLRDLGCYADFTLPAVPDPAHCGLVNTIYWATDDPVRPRSHETGEPVTPGGNARGDLLMIPGPLHLNWTARPFWKPRIETGELAANDRVRPERIALWLEAAPRIGDDAFLKLHTHGAQEKNSECLFGPEDGEGDLDLLFRGLKQECGQRGMEVFFVSAWEMVQAVETAARGTRHPVVEKVAS